MKKRFVYALFLILLAGFAAATSFTRTASSTTVSPGEAFTVTYKATKPASNWLVMWQEKVSGGCTPSLYNNFLINTEPDSQTQTKEAIFTAPSSGTCTFSPGKSSYYEFTGEGITYLDSFTVTVDSDRDNDGFNDSVDYCPSIAGNYCNGCPKPVCGECSYAYCPSSDAPYCANVPSSTKCGDDHYEYSCYWGNNFGDDVAKRSVESYCDGSGECKDYPGSWFTDKDCLSSEFCVGTGISINEGNFYCSTSKCKSDADCGSDGFLGNGYCSEGNLWDYYRDYSCINAGRMDASCTYTDSQKEKEVCSDSCSNGACIEPLMIEDTTVKVDGKKSSNLEDGDKIGKKAKPGSTVKVTIRVKNGYTDDIDIQDISGTVTIQDINGDDLEEDDDIDEIRPGRTKDLDFTFKIPQEVEEDKYYMDIEIEAEDENGRDFDIEYELKLDISKKSHDIQIEEATLNPDVVMCEKNALLYVSVLNMGSSEEDKARLAISGLGPNVNDEFTLTETPDDNARYRRSFTINTDKLAVGSHDIKIQVYSDTNLMDTTSVSLTKKECVDTNICTDSDGANYRKLGQVKIKEGTYTDYCLDSKTLYEYICNGKYASRVAIKCANNCYKGVCTDKPITLPKKTCFAFWCW